MSTTVLFRSWMSVTLVVVLIAAVGLLACLPAENAGAEEKQRVPVPARLIRFDDGDSIEIEWPQGSETVRILGIDTPEVQHLEHDLPYAQPFGEEAAGFLRGCIAASDRIELLRSGQKDKYGRTLGYLYVNGKNYSVLVIRNRLSHGPTDRFGDNGLPEQFAACKAAASNAGPPAFEEPYLYRRRMREVTAWMKDHGTYPAGPSKREK